MKRFTLALALSLLACPAEKTKSFSTRAYEDDPAYSAGRGGNSIRGVRGTGSRCGHNSDCYLPLCVGGAEDSVTLFTDSNGNYQGYCSAFCSNGGPAGTSVAKASCRPDSMCVDPSLFQFKPSPAAADIANWGPLCLKLCYNDLDCVGDTVAWDIQFQPNSPNLLPADQLAAIAADAGLVTCDLTNLDPRCTVAARGAKCMSFTFPQGSFCVPNDWVDGNDIGGYCDTGDFALGIQECQRNWCEPVTDPITNYQTGQCSFPCTSAGCPQGSICPTLLSDTNIYDNCRKLCQVDADCNVQRIDQNGTPLMDEICVPLAPDGGLGGIKVCRVSHP